MFTGIIEALGIIERIENHGANQSFYISSSLASELNIDQSVSHDGVCLTIEEIIKDTHRVTAIAETLNKTNLGKWSIGKKINLERCMQMNGRLDGHIVQGHVDDTAECISMIDENGSCRYAFRFDPKFSSLIIEKGSVTINGTSLTCFNVTDNSFEVAIIPYTYNNTSIQQVKIGDLVNIEFDVIGKYVQRMIKTNGTL